MFELLKDVYFDNKNFVMNETTNTIEGNNEPSLICNLSAKFRLYDVIPCDLYHSRIKVPTRAQQV